MRQDNIIIEKIGDDYNFFEAKIQCSSEIITATNKVYIANDRLDLLQNELTKFLNDRKTVNTYWESGEKGNETTACTSFLFSKLDTQGHIRIEVFMELDDGGKYSVHNCCFYLNTEIGLLTTFCQRLHQLKQKPTGFKLLLYNDEI